MKRRATYTVELPIRFTFLAYNDMSNEEWKQCINRELNRVLDDGYLSTYEERAVVVKKDIHYTTEEKREIEKNEKEIDELIKKLNARKQSYLQKLLGENK